MGFRFGLVISFVLLCSLLVFGGCLFSFSSCRDLDGDGFGNPASTSCLYSGLDCDDNVSSVNPGASEVCNNTGDDDCDGLVDEGCVVLREQTLLTSQLPVEVASDGRYELGLRFKSVVDGRVLRVRVYAVDGESGEHFVSLWRVSDSVRLAGPYSWNFDSGVAGWREYVLPFPVDVVANADYIVSVTNGPNLFFAKMERGFDQPVVNGDLVSYVGSGVVSSAIGSMPNTPSSKNSNYFRDVVFVASNVSVCSDGVVRGCLTGLFGVCSSGTQTCSNNNWGTCVQNSQPTAETCGDGIDQDCDGSDLHCAVNNTGVLRTFYVSNTDGNDANSGASPSSAWKSISKVNSFAFLPGDQILFKKGDIWTGQQLTITRSGTQTNRIFYGAYGNNPNKPVLTMKYMIPNSNNAGSWSLHSTNIYKLNFPSPIDWSQMPHRVFRGNGEFYENELLLQKSLIQYVYPPDPFAGDYLNNNGEFVINSNALYVYSDSGNPATDMYFAFNPFINAIIQQAVVISDADYLTIQNIDFQGGLTTMKVMYSDNIIIENCNIGAGGDTFGAFVRYSNNGVFRNNTVDNKNHNMYDYSGDGYSDGRFSGFDGLTLRGGTDNWLIENNYFADWYHTALALESHYQPENNLVTTTNNNIIRDNYFTGEHIMYTRGLGLVCVGRNNDVYDPLCMDRAANNHVYRNIFHDLPTRTQIGGNNNYYYYNVFDTASNKPYGVTRASQFISDHGISENVYIFNNLFYESDDEAFWLISSSNLLLQNNLFINVGKKARTSSPPDWIVSMDIDAFGNDNIYKNNYFWIDKSAYPSKFDEYFSYGGGTLPYPNFYMNITEWNAANGVYGDTIIGNKMLSGTKSSVINNDLTLPANSPAINAGVDISAWVPVGFRDRNGNLVNRNNPSIGAFEYRFSTVNNTVCTPEQTKSCSTGLYGICAAGTQTCSNNNWGTCIQNSQPTTETCGDGIDQDCDGSDLICQSSSSCTHYASPTGTGNGLSPTTPFKIANFWSVNGGNLAGKTLCLLEGNYTGSDSVINPPIGLSGTQVSPITIKAINDGQVLIKGNGVRDPVSLNQNNWFVLQGFDACCAAGSVVYIFDSHDNVIRRVVGWDAADGNTGIFIARYASNILYEDTAGFGVGRKIFQLGHRSDAEYTPFDNSNITVRRTWGRTQYSTWGGSDALDVSYNTNGNTVENAIITMQGYFANEMGIGAPYSDGFHAGRGWDHRNKLLGSIAYRTTGQSFTGVDNYAYADLDWNHSYIRDILVVVEGTEASYGTYLRTTAALNAYSHHPNYDAKYLTFVGGPGVLVHPSWSGAAKISHIIVTGATWHGAWDAGREASVPATGIFTPIAALPPINYVMGFGNTNNWNVAPRNYSTENPNLVGRCGNLLQYGCSEVQRPKVAGQSVGAQIQCRYENGVLTSKPLWPWPMDERIRIATCMYDSGLTKEQCKANPALGVNVTKTVFELGGGSVPNFAQINPVVCPG